MKSITTVLQNEGVRVRIAGFGAEVMTLSGQDLHRFVQGEREKWGRVIKRANIRVD